MRFGSRAAGVLRFGQSERPGDFPGFPTKAFGNDGVVDVAREKTGFPTKAFGNDGVFRTVAPIGDRQASHLANFLSPRQIRRLVISNS